MPAEPDPFSNPPPQTPLPPYGGLPPSMPPPGGPMGGDYPPGGGAPPVPNYLVQSILCTLCCCLPFGIAAIVYAAQVNGKLQAGDYAGALAASKNAKMWCWIALGGFVLQLILGALTGGLSTVLQSIQSTPR